MIDHDRHPALRWLWTWGQFDQQDRRAFTALVERYEDVKSVDPRAALALLERIMAWTAGGTGLASWYRAERAALGFPSPYPPLGKGG